MVQNFYIEKYNTVFEPGCKVIYGPHAVSGHLLCIAAEIAVRQPLHLLDFGNRCDMYFAARQLRFLTRDPAAAMQNIRLQRAFTCYQAAALLRQIENLEPGLPVIILDLLAPFLDENIRSNEIFRLFGESLDLLRDAMRTRLLLIGVKPVPQKLAPDRVRLVNDLAKNFGLIEMRYLEDHSRSGYQLRPAMRVFHSEGNLPEKNKAALPSGQMSLFDWQQAAGK